MTRRGIQLQLQVRLATCGEAEFDSMDETWNVICDVICLEFVRS
jgi:hypothetical protein